MALRKNQSRLTDTEKQKFVSAVLDLKAEKQKIDGPYTYDKYVQWHKDTVDDATGRNDAHKGPAFFAWHRVFLLEFENDFQRISGDPNLGLPYWDWRFDNSPTSSIWEITLWVETVMAPVSYVRQLPIRLYLEHKKHSTR